MKCKWYRQMRNFKSSVCHDSNIGAGFLSLCRDVLLKLHGGMEKGIRWVHVLRNTWICRNFFLKQIHSIVVWKMCSYTHTPTPTYTFICSKQSRFQSLLYSLNLQPEELGRGRTGGGLREMCPAPHPVQMCTSGSPKAVRGLRAEGGEGHTWCVASTQQGSPLPHQNPWASVEQRAQQWCLGSKMGF